MFICGRNIVHAINYQPILPFSGNFLQEVSDFDSIVEPESNPEANAITTREVMNDEDEEDGFFQRNSADSKIKRDLDEIGSIFVNNYMQRQERQPEEEKNSKPGQNDDEEVRDEDFEEEQAKASNITNATKMFLEELDNPPEEEQKQCCLKDEDEDKKKSDEDDFRTNKLSNELQMHFYKHSPKLNEAFPKKHKSVYININPKKIKKQSLPMPNEYDYVALLSENNKFINVPAVKLTMIPGRRKRKCENFEPYHTSKYRKNELSDEKDIFSPHLPILFVNTIPNLQTRYNGKLHKRASNLDPADNDYLRKADLLIQNINTSLKMGLIDKPTTVDGGILMNSKKLYSDKKNFKKDIGEVSNSLQSDAGNLETSDFSSSLVKQNIEADALSKVDDLVHNSLITLDNNKDNSFKNELKSSINDNTLSKNEFSSLDLLADNSFGKSESNGMDTFAKNEINSEDNLLNLDSNLESRDIASSVSSDSLSNNEITSIESSPLVNSNDFINNLNSENNEANSGIEISTNKEVIQTTLNPLSNLQTTNSLNKENRIELSPDQVEAFIKNEIGNLANLLSTTGKSVVDALSLNDLSKEFTPSQSSKQITETSTISQENSFANVPNNLVKNEITSDDYQLIKHNNLVKSESNSMLNKDSRVNAEAPHSLKVTTQISSTNIPKLKNVESKDKNLVKIGVSSETSTLQANNQIKSVSEKNFNQIKLNSNRDKSLIDKHLISNDVSSLDVESSKNNVEDIVDKEEIDKSSDLLSNEDGLLDEAAKNEINLSYQNLPNDAADSKMSENLVGNNDHFENSDNDHLVNALNKPDLMSSAYLFDLIKNVDLLRKQEHNSKLSFSQNKQNAEDEVTPKETCPTTTETPFTLPSIPDLNISLSQFDGNVTNAPLQNSSVGNNSALKSQNVSLPSNSSFGNDTNKSLTSNGNFSIGASSINETNDYEDENDILDLLDSNQTSSTVDVNNENQTQNTLVTNMNASSIPTIFAQSCNSSPIIATVSYEKSSQNATEISTTTAAGIVSKSKSVLLEKLHNLQKDLKLVFEVQNILSGSKKDQKSKRSKRELIHSNQKRLRRKCRKHKNKNTTEDVSLKPEKIQEVQGLGKLLQWKSSNADTLTNCTKSKRFLFKSKRKKKKRKKRKKKKKKWWKRIFGKPANQQHFLGSHPQNLH